MNKHYHLLQSLCLLVLLGTIWGSGYSIAKYATMNGVSPVGYAFWQSLGPAILLVIFSLWCHHLPPCSWEHIKYYFFCGLLGIAIPNTTMYFIAAHIPAGILAVIVNTVPMMTYPLALLMQQEAFNITRFIGIILGFIGILFILLPHGSLPDHIMSFWALAALISPLSFASCAVYIKQKRPKHCSAMAASVGMLVASAIILLPLIFLTGDFYVIWPPFQLADWIVLLEILLSSIGYLLFFKLITIAGPVFYSLVGGIVTLTGVMWGRIIFGEKLNYWNIIAISLILLAIALVSLRQQPGRPHVSD